MTKTPEQMAEEAINNRWKISGMPTSSDGYVNTLMIRIGGYKDGFIDGYQAAKSQWISVKERLPVFRQYNQNDESGYTEDVLMCFVWGRIRINNFEKVDGIVTTGYGNNLNEVTHWMPLPKPPEDK